MTEQQKFEAWADAYQMRPAGWTEACWNAWQARAAQDKSVDWQPIETAPKDGALFLCWVEAVRYGETDEGQQYQQDASDVDFCRWRACDESPNGGYFDNMAGQIADLQRVTHWMPLPPPPKGQE